MSKSISERCSNGLKSLEEQIRESTTIEALDTFMNSNVFMCNNNMPSNIDQILILDTILTYFNTNKDENIRRHMFEVMFMQKNDSRKIDFLIKLASLTLTTLSEPALDICGYWLKNKAPKSLLVVIIKRLILDIKSIYKPKINIMKNLPDYSIGFANIFLIGLTDIYGYNNPNLEVPPEDILNYIIEWTTRFKTQLFNFNLNGNMSQNRDAFTLEENSRNSNPFSGLILWTISQPLSLIKNERKLTPEAIKRENLLISSLHFQLLNYLNGCSRANASSYLITTEFVKYITDLLKKSMIKDSPQSPMKSESRKRKKSESNLSELDPCLNLAITRLAGTLQIGLTTDSIQCSKNEIKNMIKEFYENEYINIIIRIIEN